MKYSNYAFHSDGKLELPHDDLMPPAVIVCLLFTGYLLVSIFG